MTVDAEDLRKRVAGLLAANDPATMEPLEFLRARFDAGLAWVHFPVGLGGLGAPRSLQGVVDAELAAAGAPDNDPRRIGIGLGMAAPTILRFGTPEQRERFLRPLWTGEEVWCQLFSEPGAGSDLAAAGTRAVRDGDGWRVAQTTLMNERVAIGGHATPREGGMVGVVADTWRERPELRTPDLHERLLRLWVEAEVTRLAGQRLRQQLAAGHPGPEGS